jgi:DNA-binding response OmpR family regulator
MDGFAVCAALKQDRLLADVPVIFTTGLGDSEDEMRGLSLGAIDYVTKPVQPPILRARWPTMWSSSACVIAWRRWP